MLEPLSALRPRKSGNCDGLKDSGWQHLEIHTLITLSNDSTGAQMCHPQPRRQGSYKLPAPDSLRAPQDSARDLRPIIHPVHSFREDWPLCWSGPGRCGSPGALGF